MLSNGSLGAYTNSSPWPSQAGGMVSTNTARLSGPQYNGRHNTANPLSAMGLSYNVTAPQFGRFPPASVATRFLVASRIRREYTTTKLLGQYATVVFLHFLLRKEYE
jgi:hypothetical protein